MVQTLEKPATYDDILRLPEHVVGEIVGGRLVTHPRPAPRHTRAASALGIKIGGAYDFGEGGPGGWWILDEPEIHIGEDILVPDLAGWRRERLPELSRGAWFESEPDWCCEVLSPSTARVDRVEKMPIYAKWGVGHLWLIDPELRTLEVFALHRGQWTLLVTHDGSATVSPPPFESVSLSLLSLWAD